MATDQQIRDQLLLMLADDQATWSAVLDLVNRDPAFAEAFHGQFEKAGGWDMGSIVGWVEPPTLVAAYQTVHVRNSRRFADIVASIGWPTRSRVGEDGADAAWILLQHFGVVEFQERYLDLLLDLPPGERDLKHYAFTFDLLCKVKGRVPRFGTMGLPVEDEEHLDARRAAFDLPTLASQEASRQAGLVVLPAGVGRHTPGFGWPDHS